MRRPRLALLLLAAPAHAACGPAGPAYEAHAATAEPGIRYRLTFSPLPPGSFGSAIYERWRFTLLSRRTGRRLSDIVLYKSCGNGRAPCVVRSSMDNEPEDYFQSEVNELNRDFSPVMREQVAYAILLPQFAQSDWYTTLDFGPSGKVKGLGAFPRVHYYTTPHVQPDLSSQTVWLRAGCAPAAVRRKPRSHGAPHRLHGQP